MIRGIFEVYYFFTLGIYRTLSTVLRRTRNLCAVIVGARTGEANDTPGSDKGPSDATRRSEVLG